MSESLLLNILPGEVADELRAKGIVSPKYFEDVTILFTDLVGSTELLSRSGDEDAQRIFRAHHSLLAEVAAAHKGEEVKWLGDGLMVAFPSAAEAVRAAVAMQQALVGAGQALGAEYGVLYLGKPGRLIAIRCRHLRCEDHRRRLRRNGSVADVGRCPKRS